MKHLIIYAHPNPESYARSILDTVARVLTLKGHSVTVHDLYQMEFNPVLSTEDLASYRIGQLALDIKAEQAAVAKADVLTFIYPVWWAAAPAILKGWQDRVLCFGFAYGIGADGSIQQLLQGKEGAVVATHGTPKAVYEQTGMSQAMAHIIDDGVFRFTGIEPVLHLALGAIGGGTPKEDLEASLNQVAEAFSSAF
jgi:NAD(P)H dehydrogenase (quinone)